MVLRNPPYGRNQHYALEGLNSNPHLKWGCVTLNAAAWKGRPQASICTKVDAGIIKNLVHLDFNQYK